MAGDVPLRKYTWGRDLAALTEPGARATGLPEPGAPATGASEPGAPATGLPEPGAPATGAGIDGAAPLTAAGPLCPVAADLRVGRGAGRGVPVLQSADRTADPTSSRQGLVGGLLAVWDSNDTPSNTADDLTYVFFCDANGNVSQVVDVEDLANWQSLGLTSPADWHASRLAARYEYDPYGNLAGPDTNGDGVFNPATDDAGPYAPRNPFRFSTKSFDDETGFGYWGYRYYRPKLGRWLNRDPIGELGGVNVYAYVGNNATSWIDAVGKVRFCRRDPFSRLACACWLYCRGGGKAKTFCHPLAFDCICICEENIMELYPDPDAADIVIRCYIEHEVSHFNAGCQNGECVPLWPEANCLNREMALIEGGWVRCGCPCLADLARYAADVAAKCDEECNGNDADECLDPACEALETISRLMERRGCGALPPGAADTLQTCRRRPTRSARPTSPCVWKDGEPCLY